MDVDLNLHEHYQDDGDTTDEEDVDLEPGVDDEAVNNDDDGDVLQILALANQLFLLGHQLLKGQVRGNPPVPNVVFNLDLYDDAKCELEFRFHVDEIYDIGAALRLPQIMILDNDTRFQTIEGLCVIATEQEG
ncbi:MAG: hypothetical protein J3R72DRAFT_419603 [Linnemannia gamsii]|nr:MAG: hypothetical protein J3R72DRAFT_419603 [Linnemannia gamsii]